MSKKRIYIFFLIFSNLIFAQNNGSLVFEKAYSKLTEMLRSPKRINFENAVYEVENAFLGDSLDEFEFSKSIRYLTEKVGLVATLFDTNFIYDDSDRYDVLRHASLFKVMTDSFPLIVVGNDTVSNLPFKYDFEDPFGVYNYEKTFVSNMLKTKKGNCRSMTYLYKIIAERLGVKAHLSLAPLHIYIKNKTEKIGMYNTELTSGNFPTDAWIMSSGYVQLKAIQNQLYMDTLSLQESVALCLFDLAKGYERKIGYSNIEFILKCCNSVLMVYPNFANALLLKSDMLLRKNFKNKTSLKIEGVDMVNELVDPEYILVIKKLFDLGYRKMPKSMYPKWLIEAYNFDNKELLKVYEKE